MNLFTIIIIHHCVRSLAFILICTSNLVHSERYEHITDCVYGSISGAESFDFVCKPNKTRREFFNNGNLIRCQTPFHSYYKERRHEIYFKDCYIKNLPTIFEYYKAVRKLNVSNVGLEGLRSKNFESAKNLVTLIASHNEITEIPSSLFANSQKIANLDFSFNKINRIDALAFQMGDNNNLASIDLSNNLIRQIDNRTFVKLKQLEILNLGHNLIETIPNGLFSETVKLRELMLYVNQLMVIRCEHFSKLIKLELLSFAKNRLQALDVSCILSEEPFTLDVEHNSLSTLRLSPKLAELHARDNEIDSIFVNSSVENMTVFDVSGNHIKNIIEVIAYLGSSLKSLVLSDNAIGKLNVSTFAKFSELEHLQLGNTNVSNIQYGTFHHQQKLRTLDLSNNNLVNINFDILHWSSEQLQSLILDGNMLTDLENLTKVNFPSLKYLSIDRNHFECNYLSRTQRILKMDGITFTPNANLVEDFRNNRTHVNGIICFHGMVRSNLDVEEVTTETHELRENYRTIDNGDLVSLRKVEFLLIGIIILLVCLVLILMANIFVPAIRKRRSSHWSRLESVHYRSEADDQSFT